MLVMFRTITFRIQINWNINFFLNSLNVTKGTYQKFCRMTLQETSSTPVQVNSSCTYSKVWNYEYSLLLVRKMCFLRWTSRSKYIFYNDSFFIVKLPSFLPHNGLQMLLRVISLLFIINYQCRWRYII